jgi:hypothetical protein
VSEAAVAEIPEPTCNKDFPTNKTSSTASHQVHLSNLGMDLNALIVENVNKPRAQHGSLQPRDHDSPENSL